MMKLTSKQPVYLFIAFFVVNGMLANTLRAEPIYHPSGNHLTFGGMTHRQLSVSDMGNPAHPASLPNPEGDSGLYGAGLSIGLGIEYDGNDNLFELLNQLGSEDALGDGDDSTPDGGQDSSSNLKDLIASIIDPLDPTDEQKTELKALVDEIALEAIALGAVVATSVTGLNAKAFVSADVPILISNDSIGAWTFGANFSVTTNLRGINDPITFSSDIALNTIQSIYELNPEDPITTYKLGNSVSVTVDPATGDTTFLIDNNSGTITRAAAITEISLGYSRKIWQQEDNKIYVGVKPKVFDVGLSNSFVFISNIENAKSIFDALDKSQFNYTQDFSVDLGAIWSGKQYQVGATLTNINEPDFQFPEIDLSSITNPDIKNAILDAQTYVMERQLKLDAGYVTPGGAWGLNFGYDVNAVPDPMLDDYQWVSVGAGFASDNWWLPGARVGVRKNMVGTKLTYVTGGITVFNIVNLDLAVTTETIKVDGTTVPKGLVANIGVKFLF